MTNRLAIGAGVLAAFVALGWYSFKQAEQLGGLEQAMTMASEALQSSEQQKLELLQRQVDDQQRMKRLILKRQAAEHQSQQLQNQIEGALSNEPCATTALPDAVSIRLQNRIHHPARDRAGTPPG